MLEQIDLDRTVAKSTYERRLPELQSRLYELELEVRDRGIPVAIVFEGWAAAGKGGAIGALTQRLDPRGCRVVPITPPRTSETRYPWLQRFWLRSPARGQIVVFDTSWYRRVLIERIEKTVSKSEWTAAYQDILDFEDTLAAEGTVFLKFWLHISKREQSKRLKGLLKDTMADALPPEILNAPKRGFTVPLAAWFRGDLEDYAREVLVSPDVARRGFLDPAAIERMLVRHRQGAGNLGTVIWVLLMFELWCREALD